VWQGHTKNGHRAPANMKLIARTLLTLLMALTLNASMVLAPTAHSSGHYTDTVAADPCDHHGHGSRQSGHGNVPTIDHCSQNICPSCTGLPLTTPVTLGNASPHLVPALRLSHWPPSWRPRLFRPPIHV